MDLVGKTVRACKAARENKCIRQGETVWVVGKCARVRSGIYMYFIGGDCMYISRGEWKGNKHDSKYGTETKWVGRVN
jgi:hypothetical protein